MVAIWAAPLDSAVARCSAPRRHDQGQQCGHRRALERAGGAEHRGGDEYLRHRQPARIGAPGEHQRGQCLDQLADLHHPPAVVTVRGMTGDEHQQRGRKKLHQPDHAEVEGAAGQAIDLPAHRHRGDLAGETRKTPGQQKQQKRSLPEQVTGTRWNHRRHFKLFPLAFSYGRSSAPHLSHHACGDAWPTAARLSTPLPG